MLKVKVLSMVKLILYCSDKDLFYLMFTLIFDVNSEGFIYG
jgi:hypothetical protein